MKKNLKKSLILILVVAIAVGLIFAMASCKPNNGGDGDGPDNDPNGKVNYDKVAILANIKNGLNAQNLEFENQVSGIREVEQEFILRASGVNLNIQYKAKIDVEQKENSEIIFKIVNLSEHTNAIFIFYHEKNLYLYVGKNINDSEEIDINSRDYTRKILIENFSTHRFFDAFMELIESMDLRGFIYSESITSKIGSMYNSIETKNIVQVPLDNDGSVSTLITNIDLDKYKQLFNGFVENNFVDIGTKIDILTRALFGFRFSSLSSFQVSRLTLKEIETIERAKPGRTDKFVDTINIIFSDKQADNITEYEIGFRYKANIIEKNQYKPFTSREIGPLSPTEIDYQIGSVGKMHLIGKTIIPGVYADRGEEWYTEVKGDLTADDDAEQSKNKFMLSIRDKSVMEEGESAYDNVILEAWLKNGKLYIDATGLLEKYIGQSIDYQAMGFPKAYFYNINAGSFIASIYSKIFESGIYNLDMASLFNRITEGEDEEEGRNNYKDYLEFIESTEDTFILTINKKFIQTIIGEGTSIASVIGEKLNLSEDIIRAMENIDMFDNLSAKIKYNFKKSELFIEVYNKSKLLFEVDLDVQDITDEFEFIFPDANDPEYFETFNQVQKTDVQNIHAEININHKSTHDVDVSKFIGLFAGDVSGNNTPLTLNANEGLKVKGDLWQKDQITYVDLQIFKTRISPVSEELLFEIATNKNKTDEYLVHNKIHNLKYIVSFATFKELYAELVGSEALFEYDEIVRIIINAEQYGQILFRGDDIFIDIKPQSGPDDILKKYTGVDGLYAQAKLKANFAVPEHYGNINIDEYKKIELSFDNEVVYLENIYKLNFADKVNVLIKENGEVVETLRFNASYKESSIEYIQGKDSYNPLARLFGAQKSYNIRITDNINGHKKIHRLDSRFLEINPSKENPVPEKIDVIYEDGTSGSVDFEIVNFAYNNDNIINAINGEPYTTYDIIIGKGSIYELRDNIDIKIISCAIKAIPGAYAYDIPVVAKVSIDPIEYAMQIEANGKYHPTDNPNGYNPIIYRKFATEEYGINDLVIEFWEDIGNPNKGTRKELCIDPKWNFDFDEINYEGFTKLVLGKYNTIDIAMELVVENKTVSHIKINDEPNSYYTVDALISSTHTIPSITSQENQVRVYFSSGHYRIIGDGEEVEDPLFDGYYNRPIAWSYSTANFAQVDGTRMPLASGTKNKTTASFGFSSIGVQTLTLNVVCPTRVPKYLVDTSVAIVRIEYYEGTTVINENATIREAIKTHMISFYEDGTMGAPFEFDPYSSNEENLYLPSYVYMDALYAGNITKKTKYKVNWKSIRPSDQINDNRNIIDENGKIKNAFSVENYLEVNGVLGDGLTTNIRLLIHNKSAAYDKVIFYDSEGNEYKYDNDDGINQNPIEVINEFGKGSYSLKNINAYNKLVLPAKARLIFPEGTSLEDNVYDIIWKTKIGDSVDLTLEQYLDTVLRPEGGQTIFNGLIGGGDIVSQVIPLSVHFSSKKVITDEIFGIVSTLTPDSDSFSGSGDRYEFINTYSAESLDILERFLISNNHQIGVRFEDESIALDVEGIFSNVEEFISLLKSPYGSDSRFNTAYPNDTFTLKGKIKKGTTLEQNISLRLKIDAQIIAGLNFGRIENEYKMTDSGMSAIRIEETHKLYTGGALEGENSLVITINKPFLLKKRLGDSLQTVDLEEYLSHIFERVTLSFGSSSIEAKANVDFIEDFNDIAYHKIYAPGENVSYEENENIVVIKLPLNKFGIGSCEEAYSLTIKVRRDQVVATSAREDRIEVFDSSGVPKYGSSYGYLIPQEYEIEFSASGKVSFSDLVWYSMERYQTANINKDEEVTNVINNFFVFHQNRTIRLYTTLANGERFYRDLVFLGKNIINVNYKITDAGKYNINSNFNASDAGTLKIKDIYNFFPTENIISELPRRIIPLREQVQGQTAVSFEIARDWTPFQEFAKDDNPNEFDINKIKEKFTSEGLTRTPFAKTEIVGYNNQRQEIHMYVQIEKLDSGRVTHDEFEFISNHLKFDPYADPDNTGEFILPKDIALTYKDSQNADVKHQFNANDNVTYEIKNQETGEFEPITKITYNRFGHTLNTKYGSSTSSLELRIILPDGNNKTTITVECLNRVIQSVKIENKKTLENEESNLIEATYYIDPYDKETFALPQYAYFSFGDMGYIERDVKVEIQLNKFKEDDPFELINNRYVYAPSNNIYQGDQYLFYGYLRGFGENDARQYFIINVFVLNRTLIAKPIDIRDDYVLEDKGKNPIEFIVDDIPHNLNTPDVGFISNSDTLFALTNDINALKDQLGQMQENAGATYNYKTDYPSGVFTSYFVISSPVIPEIKWFIDDGGTSRELVNDDIHPNGFTLNLDGYIGYGSDSNYVKGEKIALKLRAKKWSFIKIENVDIDENDPSIPFSPFNLKPIYETFSVVFKYIDTANDVEHFVNVDFTSETAYGKYPDARSLIYWGDVGNISEESQIKHKLILRNPLKSANGINDIVTEERYTYSFQQVPIEEIAFILGDDFYFGEDNGYAPSGQVRYIADPIRLKLTDSIPEKVLARGYSTDDNTLVEIGEVYIEWPQDFWKFENISMNVGTVRDVDVQLKLTKTSEEKVPFTVRVHFVNRTPNNIATNDKPNLYSSKPTSGGYANLMNKDVTGQQEWSFEIDPTNPRIYGDTDDPNINVKYWDEIFTTTQTGELKDSYYILPSRLRIRYGAQTDQFVKTYGIPYYGDTLELLDVKWLISRDIPLEGTAGTDYITASIRSFRIKYTQGTVEKITDVLDFGYAKGMTQLLGNFYTINLSVRNKSVDKTNISEKMKIVQIGTGLVFSLQDAFEEYAIDPYNINFPDSITVTFEDGDNTTYDNLVWEYNEDYLERADIISGKKPNGDNIEEEFMYIYASFKIYGAKLYVRFKIKARNIDVVSDIGGESSITPLKGGIIYMIKEDVPEDPENPGEPIPLSPTETSRLVAKQMPTHLYYNFELGGGITEIARVPLSFERNALASVNIAKVGDYGPISGNFGKVDKNNIQFLIRVIDPKLASINKIEETNLYVMSNYIYDEINIPVTRRGEYTPGAEVEMLPNKLMLTSDIYGGPYADIKSIQYILEDGEPYALIKASYVFKLTDTDFRLFGSDSIFSDDKDKQMITMKVPVKTYVYNNAEASEARLTQDYYEVELGSTINASELPNVIVGINREIKPLWIANNINTNKAGTYKAYCYFKNTYGDIIEGSIDIVVKKYQLTYDSEEGGKKDFFIDETFLNRIYTGEEVDITPHITSEPLLRADGSYAPLAKYTIEYSIDNGVSWQQQQPIDANILDHRYQVRISVTDLDDYNVTGSIAFYLRISPLNIYASNIRFEKDGIEITSATGDNAYEYNGEPQVPDVVGVYRNVQYIREYRKIIDGVETDFSTTLRPIDVGMYELRLRFAPGQQNFIIEEAAAKRITIEIKKPNIQYELLSNMEYTGIPADAPVLGLPQNLAGMEVSYFYSKETSGIYQQLPAGSKIVDAGKYRVTVRIKGGNNYPSVNVEDAPINHGLINAEFEILKKQIFININTVRSEYLSDIKPFDSQLTIVNVNDPSEVIRGLEAINILNQNLNHDAEDSNIRYRIISTAGKLTSRHLIGSYELTFDSSIEFNFKNYEVLEEDDIRGEYVIEAERAMVIENSSQLIANINSLRDGDTVRWYLKAGNYGIITLDKNASVSIIGCYDPSVEEEKIIVQFTQIIVKHGSLNLDIIKFNRFEEKANLVIENASAVTLSNTHFFAVNDQPGEVSPKVPKTTAIHMVQTFGNTLFINNSIFKNYEKAVLVSGGSIEVTNSTFGNNTIGCEITTRNKYVYFENVIFNGNTTALNFVTEKANTSLQNNVFSGNGTAINRSKVVLRADTIYQNIFTANNKNIVPE